ncbi:MAG: putative ABC transport system permease protein [Paraglaciecola sp.]|jgi:putative ABC transport system permease protein
MFVQDELSYDDYHEDGEQIYHMGLIRKYPGRERKYAIMPAGYAGILAKEFPEVEPVCRLAEFGGSTTFKKGEEFFEEKNQIRRSVAAIRLLMATILVCL